MTGRVRVAGRRVVIAPMLRLRGTRSAPARDRLVVEEPLEIRLRGKPVAVIMRTPGDEKELAAGFLVTEGILRGPAEIGAIVHCERGRNAVDRENVVDVLLARGVAVRRPRAARAFVATASCGICGKATLQSVFVRAPRIRDRFTVSRRVLYRIPMAMRNAQAVFSETGGLHAAALFALDGHLLDLREDIGRHNAVDKVIGASILSGRFPLGLTILAVSGRASLEIIQKALVARIPIVVAISAASSLAVEMARRGGITLAGFLRGEQLNLYAGAGRLESRVKPSPRTKSGAHP